ncbi:SDR family oxidoreductase [Rhodopseudomonas sp. HC1]|uniref:SDR family NAD(P)-dependent oxidoreductase n=1 Tax=Rhodopseudomonas infernalis TaxID=2897386 RepID=UPI001EE7BE10|nr:SDR family NAD(P)-dependent oxidoreductase [Rhodopseudomonas infernalis]MCG6205458.1 SDR family oxidoreductase [Rhodopseudomonas infernalis]
MTAAVASSHTIALVTGGGGEIGRAIALRLAETAEAVAVVDLDLAAAEETAAAVEALGRRALAIRADVSDEADAAGYVEAAEQKLGPIGIFANNAGIEGVVAPLEDYPAEMFDRVMRVNVRGIFLGLKFVIPRMRQRGQGAIINTASTSAIRGRAGLAGYVASKHAVLGLTRTAALELIGSAIRVNAVLPGPIESRMIRELNRQAGADGSSLARAGSAPYGHPDDVAAVVALLASNQTRHVHGAAWVVDAGITVA